MARCQFNQAIAVRKKERIQLPPAPGAVSDVRLPRGAGLVIADKLFGSAAALAPEADKIGFVFPHLMGGYFHERATAKANGIFAGV